MKDIRDYTLKELEEILRNWQAPIYHARQVFSWIYKKEAFSFDDMTNLSLALRLRLKENFSLNRLNLLKSQESTDGTKKFLFSLSDGNLIESVLIPAHGRNTACLSTQVGCRYKCNFCASGMLGFRRNLEPWEIIAQVLEINRKLKNSKISHIVFMGIGEPLDNYGNVLKAIRIINSKEGLNIAVRRITISTSGIVPGIERLSREGLQIELSVSLHASDDKTRSLLMPINKKYPLKQLIETCRKYSLKTKRQVTFEYILIKGINCSREAHDNLVALLKGWNSKVNLITYNKVKWLALSVVEGLPYAPAEKSEILSFQQKLKKARVPTTIRKSRGQDIEGACGQLRVKFV